MKLNNKLTVGVVGLGYVGLTLATVLAEVGFRVLGIEKRQEIVDLTNSGKPHFSEAGLEEALNRVTSSKSLIAMRDFDSEDSCDVYIITVGTPLSGEGVARLDMIEAASRQVASNMRDGALVILRSTVKVGTSRNVVARILSESGKKFWIAMCPERTLEGKALQELRELPQIIGADEQGAKDRASSLFSQITNSIVQVSSLESAEVIKLVDNTYRDVQFAFANEVARLCDAIGVNAQEVIASGKLGYKRTNIPLPGLVGGPCLEKDPHILSQSAKEFGIDLEITSAARLVNERQPEETVEFIISEMKRRKFSDKENITLLGMAFKGVPATDDLRGSMSLKVLSALKKARPKLNIRLYDPVISPEILEKQVPGYTACATLKDAIADSAVVIICNNHPDLFQYKPLVIKDIMRPNGFIYDYWNNFSNLQTSETSGTYYAVGNQKEELK